MNQSLTIDAVDLKSTRMNRIKNSSLAKSFAMLVLLPSLVSCGSGADDGKSPLIACAQYNTVSPGFAGDLNIEGPGGGGDGGGKRDDEIRGGVPGDGGTGDVLPRGAIPGLEREIC